MPALPASIVTLSGDITIHTITEAHAKLAAALPSALELHITLQDITQADLTLVQLLLSARHSAERDGKRVLLTQPLPDALASELARGGFLNDDDVFWTKRG